jgi:hypothetical protein
MPLRGRRRTRRCNNNAGALTIFWRSGGRSFSEIEGKRRLIRRASLAVVCALGTRGDPDGREGPRGVPVS